MSGLTRIVEKIIVHMAVAMVLSVFFSRFAWSYGEGEMIPIGGTNIFDLTFGTVDVINNTTGSQVERTWDLGREYQANFYCTTAMPAGVDSVYYTSITRMRPSSSNPDYLYFNDYLDVKIEVFIGGNKGKYVTVPFYDVSNLNNLRECIPPKTLVDKVESGSKGRITFLTTKPVINGIDLSSVTEIEIFGRKGLYGPAMLSEPLTRVILKSGIITVPDKCVVNEGTPITIEFGPVGSASDKLNGQNYKKPLAIDVVCSGGSFGAVPLNIKMALQTAGAGITNFNPDFFGTTGKADRKDLGIVIRNKNNQIVKPNTFYPIDVFNKNQGRWDLTAAPVANQGRDIPEGEFSSSATVVAEFN
ncbi:fimbrial protein [Erwinia sorbitola]|uniref:Fimbrial protein n=1 Tax=Erwinia sorbitola TaxID=2681984 RepID=A0A6I6EZB9_9GAMM|nr:fimbrial protein [Erwinia sorbitola]MTD28825.1 fimbrial protein [Erwinia sorbitola]QGU89513.1 fimbrial protein [Erwinia sorbitola]